MKNAWLFILVFVVLGMEVALLYSAKNLVDKSSEYNMPPVQQETMKPVSTDAMVTRGALPAKQGFVNNMKTFGSNEIHFDFIVPDSKPDTPDLLDQTYHLRPHHHFKILITENPHKRGATEKDITWYPDGQG